jgi:uncharacterized membrane protein YedE/YeeE
VFGVVAKLASLTFSSVAGPSTAGLAVGLVLGLGLACLLIARVLRAQGHSARTGLRRWFGAVCCLLWGLTLPFGLGAAGLLWGAGLGVGSLVEGPVPVPNDGWLDTAVGHLRERATGGAASGPTVQEAIEALVAPAVFREAGATIRATAGHDARLIALVVLGLAALLAGALVLAWRRPPAAAPTETAPRG